MKILIVDDDRLYLERMVSDLRASGLDTEGLSPYRGYSESGDKIICMSNPGRSLSEKDAIDKIREADVIFLDHDMGCINGRNLLRLWEKQGIDIACKRILGISSSKKSQEYYLEYFGPNVNSHSVKKRLGI